MRALLSNIGTSSAREAAPALALFTVAAMLFAAQGLSSHISAEVLGFKDNVLPLQVVLTLLTYGALQVFEPRFRALAIIVGHKFLSAAILSLLVVTLVMARAPDASPDEIKAPFQLLIGLSVFHIGYFLASNPQHLRTVLSGIFLVVGLSGTIALFELSTGISMPWARGDMVDHSIGEGAQGLEWFPVSYSYSVLVPVVLAGYFVFTHNAWYGRPNRLLCGWAFVFGGLGLFAASSRSGLVGLILGLSVTYLLGVSVKLRARRLLAFSVLLAPLAIVFAGWFVLSSGKTEVVEDARLYATYAVYLPLIITNPIGVSDTDVTHLATFFESQEALGLDLPLETVLLGTAIAPHNGFMAAGIRYGWVGVLVAASLFGAAMLRTRASINADSMRMLPETHLQVALLGALVALLVHVWFHNMSILTGDMRNWLPFGLVFGCLNMKALRTEIAAAEGVRPSGPGRQQARWANAGNSRF
jgi:hypothetical protein